jgi:hypothetical protein
MASFRSTIQSVRRHSAADFAAFGEAWLALGTAALQLQSLPFERVMHCKAPTVAGTLKQSEIDRLVWALDAARRRSWLRAVCIESALALRAMLRRRGVASTLHYGIRNDEGEGLKAHVWLSLDGKILIGGETSEQFTQVATFDPSSAV